MRDIRAAIVCKARPAGYNPTALIGQQWDRMPVLQAVVRGSDYREIERQANELAMSVGRKLGVVVRWDYLGSNRPAGEQ